MDISSYIEWTSITPKYETFGENFLWAYSYLQMLGATINMKEDKFTPKSYMVRAKAFKAYKEGKWKIRDMYEINRMKVRTNDTCWYCRAKVSPKELTADHVFPRVAGGGNNMENIIFSSTYNFLNKGLSCEYMQNNNEHYLVCFFIINYDNNRV